MFPVKSNGFQRVPFKKEARIAVRLLPDLGVGRLSGEPSAVGLLAPIH